MLKIKRTFMIITNKNIAVIAVIITKSERLPLRKICQSLRFMSYPSVFSFYYTTICPHISNHFLKKRNTFCAGLKNFDTNIYPLQKSLTQFIRLFSFKAKNFYEQRRKPMRHRRASRSYGRDCFAEEVRARGTDCGSRRENAELSCGVERLFPVRQIASQTIAAPRIKTVRSIFSSSSLTNKNFSFRSIGRKNFTAPRKFL